MVDSDGRNLIFILSTPRAGSTLLAAMLGSHSRVLAPPEPWVLLSLTTALQEHAMVVAPHDAELARGALHAAADTAILRAATVAAATTFYNSLLARAGKTTFVDKTPRYYHILPLLDELFPQAVKIWLQRNPLDVFASCKTTWGLRIDELVGDPISPYSFDATISFAQLSAYFMQRNEVKTSIRYEDLVADPCVQVQRLCEHIALPFEAGMLEYGANDALVRSYAASAWGDRKLLAFRAATAVPVGRWRQLLSADEIRAVLTALGADIFERLGYGDLFCEAATLVGADVAATDRRGTLARLQEDAVNYARISSPRSAGVEHTLTVRENAELRRRLQASEADRAARLDLIHDQARRLAALDTACEKPQQGHQPGERNATPEPQLAAARPPRFSIVTPSYNQRPFITETIESVLSQEGNFEVQYFVMDGGSTDGSVEVIKHYADRVATGDWPVKCAALSFSWVSRPDGGQSDAINQGLRRATGDFASYINSDDAYFPGAFARVAAEFAAHPDVHLIYGDGDVIDATGNRQWEWLSRPYHHSVMTSYHFLWNDFSNYIMQQATFWRTSVMGRIGEFDETFQYAMDVEYWVRAAHAGLALHHLAEKLGKFRLIPGTKSRSSPTVFWPDHLEIYRRYRGSRSLAPYFGCYYYNLAQQLDLDPERALRSGEAVFDRWRSLPHDEQQTIAQRSERGHALACLLIAADLHSQRRAADARASFRRAVAYSSWLALHPFAWRYLLKRITGHRLSPWVEALARHLLGVYRRLRYDYRYQR